MPLNPQSQFSLLHTSDSARSMDMIIMMEKVVIFTTRISKNLKTVCTLCVIHT